MVDDVEEAVSGLMLLSDSAGNWTATSGAPRLRCTLYSRDLRRRILFPPVPPSGGGFGCGAPASPPPMVADSLWALGLCGVALARAPWARFTAPTFADSLWLLVPALFPYRCVAYVLWAPSPAA
jgi:hypothetical protein